LGISSGKIVVVGGGYDNTVFTRVRKSPAGTVNILYAGKFNRSKGVPWLLKSLMKLTHQNWHLHMAGGGSCPEYEECLKLAGKLREKVTNHGFVSQRKLSELMQKAHLQVLPSFFECLPLVLFEGLSSGCRIITTNLSGFSEIFGMASTDTVLLINLPPLETIDRPFKKDELALENVLCDNILKMIATIRKSPDFDDPHAENIAFGYTWPRVFERISSVYAKALQL
jgi:glycosyltransferase involved in cell wall biosynthesis